MTISKKIYLSQLATRSEDNLKNLLHTCLFIQNGVFSKKVFTEYVLYWICKE